MVDNRLPTFNDPQLTVRINMFDIRPPAESADGHGNRLIPVGLLYVGLVGTGLYYRFDLIVKSSQGSDGNKTPLQKQSMNDFPLWARRF